ncbi:MAG: glycosyltransferase [Actinomycetota bacterium]
MTRRPIVHQFTAVLAGRDALGHHTLAVDDLLPDLGVDSRIYAAHVHAEVGDRGRDFRAHDADPAPDLIIYQASTGTPVADHVIARREPLVVSYHNMTPSSFFDPWEPHVAAELDHGRRQLARICRRAQSGVAVSEYNAGELRALGLTDVSVAPVLFEPLAVDAPTAPAPFDGVTLLFVGRLAPNKAQQDLVGVLAALHAGGTAARLVLVGGSSSGAYVEAIETLARRLGVAESLVITGSVSEAALLGWYGAADVFVSVSEHEGFCVPVVEAMGLGVPVVAFGSSALPETIGGAGLVLDDKSPGHVAAAIERVVGDDAVRAGLVDRGHQRAAELGPPAALDATRAILDTLVAGVRS